MSPSITIPMDHYLCHFILGDRPVLYSPVVGTRQMLEELFLHTGKKDNLLFWVVNNWALSWFSPLLWVFNHAFMQCHSQKCQCLSLWSSFHSSIVINSNDKVFAILWHSNNEIMQKKPSLFAFIPLTTFGNDQCKHLFHNFKISMIKNMCFN